jgi:peptidoglycan pentaglycine glycine transferase (the first glycine)
VIRAVEVHSAHEWHAAVNALAGASFMQAWDWGEFKARTGWRASRWLWRDEDQPSRAPAAAAQVLERSLRLGPLTFCVSYAPKGPLLRSLEPPILETVLATLEDRARDRRAIQIKIDPDIPLVSRETDDGEETRHAEGERLSGILTGRGWRFSSEQIQFRSTVVLDLAVSEDKLLGAMKQKTRYNVRLAERKGVSVRHGTPADLPRLYRMYAATAHRDGFIIRDEAYYEAAWGGFMRAGSAHAFIAEYEAEPIAAIIIFAYARRASYVYGMSLEAHRERMPNHLLQWEAIRWARSQGCAVYDLWGAPDSPDPGDPLWGVYNFKQGFGGRFVRHVGAWDYAPRRGLYTAYTRVLPRLLALMRLVARNRIRRTVQGTE